MTQPMQIWQEVSSGQELLKRQSHALQSLIAELDLVALERGAMSLDDAYSRGSAIYCAGNGGSAATAAHLATDLGFGRRMDGQARPRAISLVASVPFMTAVSNDIGYDDVFVEQMKGNFKQGDVLVAISASGNSENVLRATRFAHEHGGASFAMAGFDGGQLKALSNVCLHVSTPPGEYELVEDVHHAACHMLANYLKYTATQRSKEMGIS